MRKGFRVFSGKEEKTRVSRLIASIDKGEKWIFESGPGSSDFGGFIDRIYYPDNLTLGVFCSSIFSNRLRILEASV